MTFKLTHHARERIEERNVPKPTEVHLRRPKKSMVSKFRFDTRNYVFLISKKKYVYICSRIGSGLLLVITAYNIKGSI